MGLYYKLSDDQVCALAAGIDVTIQGRKPTTQPKPLVKRWRWLLKSFDGGRYFVSSAHYTDQEVVDEGFQVICKIEETAQEEEV